MQRIRKSIALYDFENLIKIKGCQPWKKSFKIY